MDYLGCGRYLMYILNILNFFKQLKIDERFMLPIVYFALKMVYVKFEIACQKYSQIDMIILSYTGYNYLKCVLIVMLMKQKWLMLLDKVILHDN